MAKTIYYTKETITPQTRLSDLVEKKYHPQLKEMIDELRQLTKNCDNMEWWRVKRLEFIRTRSSENYKPIARFIKRIRQDEGKALKCSKDTLFYYIASNEHSNLNKKWKYIKSVIYNMIAYKYV